MGKLWINLCTALTIHHQRRLWTLLDERRPLITVSNHESCADDMLMFCNLDYQYLNSKRMRWVIGAHDICFTNIFTAYFFALGRVIPVVRGEGVYQRGMNMAVEKLNHGGWIHIFPEGKINLFKEEIRYKWGVARMVMDCAQVPLVVPIYHLGTDDVLPNHKPYFPRYGKRVTVVVGRPLDFTHLLEGMRGINATAEQIRMEVTERIQKEMKKLKKEATILHNKEYEEDQTEAPSSTEKLF